MYREKILWQICFKKNWNSEFNGGMRKRAWKTGFTGGMGKQAWNSGFTGGIGKRAWNSRFTGLLHFPFNHYFSKTLYPNKFSVVLFFLIWGKEGRMMVCKFKFIVSSELGMIQLTEKYYWYFGPFLKKSYIFWRVKNIERFLEHLEQMWFNYLAHWAISSHHQHTVHGVSLFKTKTILVLISLHFYKSTFFNDLVPLPMT